MPIKRNQSNLPRIVNQLPNHRWLTKFELNKELWSICKNSAHESVDVYRLIKVLQSGADVHNRSNGWTVLLWICWKNQNISLIQLIRLLIDYGANANDADVYKNSVLHILVRFNQTPTLMFSIKELLKGGVDVNQVDSRRWTVLHHLARFNQSKELLTIMELLLDNGADIQAKDLEGWNVLFYLARFYQSIDLIDFFHLMIQRGIDLSVRDLEGWNVLHVVCRFYCQPGKLLPIFKLLVESGVDLHLRTYTKLHALELLLFNSGGDFHSTCMWVIKHRRADWERLIWNEESLLNMAKLGCQKWTFYFSKDVAFHCMDGHGNSVLYYLQEVGSESSLCPRCKPRWQFNKFFMYNLDGVNDKKPVRQFSFQSFIPSFHETFIPLRSCIVSSEHDLKPVPKPARWRRMVQAWQDSRLGVDEVEFYLSENSHWNCHLNCQWCSIFDDVKSYLNSLIKKIHTFDDRFESDSLLEYGSWAERSDILSAKEFDFGILLKHFKALPSKSSSMASSVVFTKPDSQADSFYVSNYGICSGRMLYYYKALVEEATRRIWNVHFFQPLVSMSETCVTITFTYRGKKQKPTKISVDLSLVVTVPAENGTDRRFRNSQTSNNFPEVLLRLNMLRQKGSQQINFVANRRKEKGLWKVSYFEMERDVFLHPSCFPDVSHILRLLKFFVLMANHRTNPHREGEQHIIQRKTTPSSYALKTCLFYYMNQTCRPPWKSEDRLLHCIGVLKVYVSSGPQLKSFFFDDVVACSISIDSRRIVNEIITKLERMKNLRISYGILFDEVIKL